MKGPETPRISAVVPAAGLSRRFGGPNKLLLPWRGSTVIGSVVRTLTNCDLEVILVTGRDSQQVCEVAQAAAFGKVECVFNPQFEQGLGTSIAVGVARCIDADGVLIALGDMPDLSAEVVSQLIEALAPPVYTIVAPVYADEPNRPGHPVLFGSDHFSELMGLEGDTGAKRLLERSQNLRLVRIPGVLPDLDKLADRKNG